MCIFYHIFPVLLRMRNVSDKSCRENQNTFCVKLLLFGNRAVYDIMLKNFVELGRSQITTGACALHTGYLSLQHTQYVILPTSPFTTMFARMRLNVTLHVHSLSCSTSVHFVKWAYSSVALFLVFPCYYSL